MKPMLDYQKTDMLDLIFDGRNKSYGAYTLRREYPSTLKKSILGALLLFALLIGIPLLINYISLGSAKEYTKHVIISLSSIAPQKVKLNEPVKVKPQKPSGPKPPATKFTPLVIVEDNKVIDKLPSNESIKTNTKTETVIVPVSVGFIPSNPSVNNSVIPIVTEEKAVSFADEMPSFPGGDNALMNYLKDRIKYTKIAWENGITGKVIISFIVGKDGEITDIKVRRSLGGGLDEVAVNAVKSMPPWKPGKNKGNAIKVMYNLPLSFNLN